MRKGVSAKLFTLLTLAIVLFGCGGGGGDDNTPPVSTHGWAWVSGSNTVDQPGTYGTRGTAALSNIPGARTRAVSWIDSSGKLWLFGGNGEDSAGNGGWLNDLWKYDPTTLEWTWVSGSNTVNQLGTYGTKGLADPANVPGARGGAVSWIDSSGNLWLFGGVYLLTPVSGFHLSDLWKYDPATNEWTWVSGSQIGGQPGTYGTLGVADPSNVPGAREEAVSWIDPSGNLWLFGGYGFGDDSFNNFGNLNDLWMYDGTNWTWVSGSNIVDQTGRYGTKGIAAPSNVPGARGGAVSWIDPQGNFWLFGGSSGYDPVLYYLNDLWKYDPATLEWTWVSGSDAVNQVGVYGTKGAAALSNTPGARGNGVSWIDSAGKLWLFGGSGFDSAGNAGGLNDLWQYIR